MKEEFLPFRKFYNEEEVQDIIDFLNKNQIENEISNSNKYFDPSFSGNTLNKELWVKLRPEDFDTANNLLNQYYANLLDRVDSSYYLFDFTDQELTEIILKPDEWGNLDYQLAQKLLKDRDKEIKPDLVELLRKQRNEDLAKPEIETKQEMIFGYISAILGGPFGVYLGYNMAYGTKLLPDGRKIYSYQEPQRKRGKILFVIGLISFILWMTLFVIIR